jgi:cytoskeletal protein RodZ
MAETDRYDRMNSDQLQDEARARGLNLDQFQSLANNRERAQQLRDHDAARDADAQVAQQNAEQQRQAQEQQAQAQQDAGQDQARAQAQAQANREAAAAQTGSGQPQDTAASPAPQSDDSLANAQAAAVGDLRTDEGIDTSQVEQIGGDPAFTDDRDPNQQ